MEMHAINLVFIFATIKAMAAGEPMVKTGFGEIAGMEQTTHDARKVDAFLGVRYARAERFEKPKLIKSWSGTFDATHIRHACPQKGKTYNPGHVFGPDDGSESNYTSEDCLFLNIWRPKGDQHNLAVVVWLHGGAFKTGTIFTNIYDGRELSAQAEIIVVSVAYRLGVFGFLATEKLNGNQGLYDQMAALEWIHHVITQFGGDKHRVTIMGESAGSIACGALVQQPRARPYFHRAILQSGSPLKLVIPLKQSLATSMFLAKKVDCAHATSMIDCFRTKSVEELIEASSASFVHQLFLPTYDNVEFIDPRRALQRIDIDLMYGIVKNEGVFFFSQFHNSSIITLRAITSLIRGLLTYSSIVGDDQDSIVEFYTTNLTETSDTILLKKALEDVVGDYALSCPTILYGEYYPGRLPRRVSPRYAYLFNQANSNYGCSRQLDQVCHQSDVLYVFGEPLKKDTPFKFSKGDHQFSLEIMKAWSNFIKHGRPGKLDHVEWEASTPGHSKFMNLKFGDYRMGDSLAPLSHCRLWRKHLL